MPAPLPSEMGRPRIEVRQHSIMLFLRPAHRRYVILLAVLAVAALIGGGRFVWLFALTAALLALLRYRVWAAERIILTNKRIIHIHGVLETTRTEASLRLDRISGLRLIETFPGRMLGYATISVEAPGDHPGLKHLYRMSRVDQFYEHLRDIVFHEDRSADPDDVPGDYITAELPDLTAPPYVDHDDRPGRHRR